jgi:hypothetical protein
MGRFGPGTKTAIKLARKEFKATANAIENKNRPEAVFIEISTWVSPKLSLVRAKTSSSYDPEVLANEIMVQFDKELGTLKRKIANFFDPNFFNTSSIIFTYDFQPRMNKVDDKKFLGLVVHIETVNDIDFDDNPKVYSGTGKLHNIPFKDFVRPLEVAANKILELDAFSKSKSSVDFSIKKGK